MTTIIRKPSGEYVLKIRKPMSDLRITPRKQKPPISDEELAFQLVLSFWNRRDCKSTRAYFDDYIDEWLAVARRARRLLLKGNK